MENIIEVRDVTKVYSLYARPIDRLKETFSIARKRYHETFKAIDNISFDIKKGECFGIIGTNGSGKSTILKIITGVLNQTNGKVMVNGKISALLELGAGFNLDYTGIENIYMNGMVLGYSKEKIDSIIPKIIEFAQIGDFINQPVKLYSSGMFARLAFAVAINVDPDILIVDEALSVGDIFFQAKCYKKFEEFKSLGKTIIFVTHDMTSILKYCDRVMLLNKGKIINIGAPNEIVNLYKKILSNVDNLVIENKNIDNWKSNLPLNSNPVIYGNGKANIIDFAILDEDSNITSNVFQGNQTTIVMKVFFTSDVISPIFAWKLKNDKGLEIVGTNTMYEGLDFGLVKKNSVFTISFITKLFLSPNQYLLDLGVTRFENDNLEILCRNHEITTLEVLSTRHNVGFVNPCCEIQIEREDEND